jgi:hypothetical protein
MAVRSRGDVHIASADADVDLGEADQVTALHQPPDPARRAAPPRDQTLQEKDGRITGAPGLSHDRHQCLENRAEGRFPGHVRHLQLGE